MAVTPPTITPVNTSISPINNAIGGGQGGGTSPVGGFGEVLQTMVNQAVTSQKEAAALSQAAAQGENVPLQDVVTALGKAELTLQTLVSVRDRAIEAYQEILRMPI